MRKIIVEGNSVYEVDEEALMKKRSENINDNSKRILKKESSKNITSHKQEKREINKHANE